MPDILKEMRQLDPHCRARLARAAQFDETVVLILQVWKDLPDGAAVSFASALCLLVHQLARQKHELLKQGV